MSYRIKPSFYRIYGDAIFVSFESPESTHSFLEYISSKHQNINFTVEQKNIGSLLFLDVKICRKNGKFVTSVYRKPTFSGVFTHRSFSISCDFKIFHILINHLKPTPIEKQ